MMTDRQHVMKWVEGSFFTREPFAQVFPHVMMVDEFEGHGHAISDIDGLYEALAALPDGTHSHEMSDIAGLEDALLELGQPHTHNPSDITGLNEHINSIIFPHGHGMSEITGLSAALSGKSDVSHTHPSTDIDDLEETMDEAIQDALDGFSVPEHGHVISDITSLQTTLDGKIAKSPKSSAITNASGGLVPASVTVLGISVPTNSSYIALTDSHNALVVKVNAILSALRVRDIIDT